MKSGVEIAKTDTPPYLQARFRIHENNCFESFKLGERSQASCEQRKVGEGETEITYKLDYDEDYAYQIKTWLKMSFAEKLRVHYGDGSSEIIDCQQDKSTRPFKGLTFGVCWDRIKVFDFNEKSPTAFELNDYMLKILWVDQLTHVVLYRNNKLTKIEFTFIWRRFKIPRGTYSVKLKLERFK